jgi:hypothetical protein
MSTIGAAGIALASSIVGSSRPEGATNQIHAASAEQKARADQKQVLAQALDDVADPQFGSDRDADGRLLYRRSSPPTGEMEGQSVTDQEGSMPRPVDPFGDRGKSLDLDA